MPDTPTVLALIPACGEHLACAQALMRHARRLADRHGGAAQAVLAGPPAAREAALADARAAGLDQAWFITTAADGLQTQQYVDLYAEALRPGGPAALPASALMLVAAHPDSEAFAGALAARLNAAPLGRCADLSFDAQGVLHARRGAYGNRLDISLACAGAMIAAVRAQAGRADAGPVPAAARQTAVHVLDDLPAPRAPHPLAQMARNEPHAPLEGARVVVSGGRGLGNDAAFPLLYDIAARLDGAVGASLPAVDAGWAPVTRQVGISGKYVSPDLYLAIGISGTPQHLAGIDPHTRIVAINSDADAPIFDVAEAGAVAEWQALLPALLHALDNPTDA
ncbi:electron transfer flavoprotein subunit alpha/FixB family protein [Bordetella genomosp. 13]|uniref:electron transfer flavoprotein subunit alpha/FixB family protein n=1 Tax=Bordetella genomosp. 13 TaxID=463040 RepID=UPI00119F2777|nr:FAD-binding protein [Bordetella genomosp. 13]